MQDRKILDNIKRKETKLMLLDLYFVRIRVLFVLV